MKRQFIRYIAFSMPFIIIAIALIFRAIIRDFAPRDDESSHQPTYEEKSDSVDYTQAGGLEEYELMLEFDANKEKLSSEMEGVIGPNTIIVDEVDEESLLSLQDAMSQEAPMS